MIYHRYPFLYYLVHWSQYLFSISCLLTNYVGVKHALYKFFYALRCYNQLLNGSIFCFTTNHVALHSIDSSPLVFHIGRLWGAFLFHSFEWNGSALSGGLYLLSLDFLFFVTLVSLCYVIIIACISLFVNILLFIL